jgi:hypothetical protein
MGLKFYSFRDLYVVGPGAPISVIMKFKAGSKLGIQTAIACLEVYLWLFFKIFFILKYIKMIFFLFLKIIFKISALKLSKIYKKKFIFF